MPRSQKVHCTELGPKVGGADDLILSDDCFSCANSSFWAANTNELSILGSYAIVYICLRMKSASGPQPRRGRFSVAHNLDFTLSKLEERKGHDLAFRITSR